MSSEQDFKKLSTSSGGGYKPLQELEDKLSEVRPETSKERALRQRLERQAELKYTAEDYARWSANRNRAIEENGTSNIYDGINEVKEAISNFFTPKRKDKRLPPFNPEEVLVHPELQGIKPVNIVSAQYSAGHERIMMMIQWFFMFQGNSASICSTVSAYGN